MLAEYARAILVNCPIRPVDSQNQGGLKTMAKSRLRLIAPATEKRTVMPTRQPNTAYRTREHLTEREVTKLMKAAKANRWGQRDATMILVAYRHGLRVSELVDLRWDQIDFDHPNLHVRRVKKGTPSNHNGERLITESACSDSARHWIKPSLPLGRSPFVI
jgi:integrase